METVENVKYWGSLEIDSIEAVERKGPGGEDLVRVSAGTYPPFLIGKKYLQVLGSAEPSSLDVLMEAKSQLVAELVAPIVMLAGVKNGEIRHIFAKAENYLANYSAYAVEVAINGNADHFIPGIDPVAMKSLLDYFEIRESYGEQNPIEVTADDTDGSDGEGSGPVEEVEED